MDYPIPGQSGGVDLPADDLTRIASERAGNLLMPYEANFGARPIEKPLSNNPGSPLPSSSGIEDKLYQSIHPDTFSKVLETIMQFVTGKPIPKYQAGTDYVEKSGPAILHKGEAVIPAEENRPAVKGQTIPYVGGQTLTYGGMEPISIPGKALETTRRAIQKISPYLGPLNVPLKAMGQMGETFTDLIQDSQGLYAVPGTIRPGGQAPPYTGPRPWKEKPPSAPAAPAGMEEGWRDYDEGIKYRLGPEDRAGDEAARLRILEEAGRATERYGVPVPSSGGYLDQGGRIRIGAGPGYYDVHPEEQYMDTATSQNRELMEMYRRARTPKDRAILASMIETNLKIPAEYYRAGMEYGPGSPRSQEQLAHAELLRRQPELEAYKISEQGRAHLEGIDRQVAGHIAAAKIAAKDPIMQEIGTVLTQAQKMSELYETPFDPVNVISQVLKVYKAMGQINEQQWNALPDEYKGIKRLPDFETFKARAKAQESKMSEKALKDAYGRLGGGA